jgi:hypothetical protein
MTIGEADLGVSFHLAAVITVLLWKASDIGPCFVLHRHSLSIGKLQLH